VTRPVAASASMTSARLQSRDIWNTTTFVESGSHAAVTG
jgi:hypothetical protein